MTVSSHVPSSPRVPLVAGLLLVVATAAFARAAVLFGGTAPTVAAQVALSVVGLAGAALLWRRDDRAAFLAVVVAAVAARLMLLPLDPLHSNDVYRYLWDGRDLLHGVNPYVTAPSSPALAALRRDDWLYAHIDWANVPTLYPPLDLALYALGAALDGRHLFAIKSVLLLGDLGTIAVLAAGLRRAGLPLGRLAVYAWNPLVITEFAHGGHEEAWAVFWIVAALVALRAERPTASALSLAAAALTKLYPLAFVPVFFAARRTWHAAAIAGATVVLAYLPFFLWSDDALGFLHAFAYGYRFNDSLHELVGTGGSIALFGLAVAAAVLARLRGARLAALIFLLELAYLLCSPNVYPWYATIFPAIAPLVPYGLRGAWRPLTLGTLAWTALTPLSYADTWVFAQGSAGDAALHAVEYAPLAAGLALALHALLWTERVRTFAALSSALASLRPRPRRPRRFVVTARTERRFEARVDLRLDAPHDAESREARP